LTFSSLEPRGARFCVGLRNFISRCYDVISIFQDGSHSVAILSPVSGFVTLLI